MQIIKTTTNAIFSTAFTLEMLTELATKYIGMSQAAVDKIAKQTLNKAATGNGKERGNGASAGVGNLEFAKLRTVIVQKLQDSQDFGATFKTSELELEFACLPDLDIGKAGANKRTTRANKGSLAGAYTVTTKGVNTLKAVEQSDPGRWEIVQHIIANGDFAAYSKAAPQKAVKKVGSITTAAAEMTYAVRSGWVVPVATA